MSKYRAMTVSNLIAQLKAMPQNAPVAIDYEDCPDPGDMRYGFMQLDNSPYVVTGMQVSSASDVSPEDLRVSADGFDCVVIRT